MSEPVESTTRVPELGRFRLGKWSVRQAEGVLCLENRSVRLEPRVMDVLACLAGEPGRVVAKEELLTAVWGGAFVEEGVLSQAIHSLRKALGDDARQPRYVQTIPKRGYRLLAPVEPERNEAEAAGEASPAPSSQSPANPGSTPMSRGSRRVRLIQAAAGLMVALALWIAWSRHEAQRQVSAKDGIRIVVLPFENLGKPADPDFAAGLTEEITANLSLLRRMQVIPGSNALDGKGVAKPLSEIGDELGVDYVLQGKVSWPPGGRQVRVLTQLIRMADKALLPADPFEGDAGSPFKAQQEISRAVLTTLGIALTPEQSRAFGERSTANPEAYRAYVQGLVLKDQPFYSPPHLEKAAQMFEQAVDADPNFAEAWAELSMVHSYLAFNTDRSSKRKEQARGAMERAVALGPNLVAARLAQAEFSYRCLEDYDAALEHLAAATRMAPNLPEVFEMRGHLLRRRGHLPEAIAELTKASKLNPRRADLVGTIAETYGALRDYDRADSTFERAISLAPDEPFNYEQRARIRLAWTGNLNEARAILEDSPVRDSPQLQLASVYFDLFERKFQQAQGRLSSESRQKLLSPADQTRLAAMRVMALERLGDHQKVLALAEASLPVLKLRIAQYSRHPLFRIYLALALARLGRGEEALAQAEQAVRQSEHDVFSGPLVVEDQAMVVATLGRRREAVALLSRLLSTPYRHPISVNELRLDPVWDSLRGDPGFEALLREHEK
ncbi:MAG TPA: winged helix-turn-helix domain-containing protein [Thermoanaerobaculia bacterium]|nr:winged helix-turn-helix domain-containing protein [Thermoanaerobaculia bacterium]